jgi:hypothetical protein
MVCFHTKNFNLGTFGAPWNGKCWYVLWPFGIFYGHFVKFVVFGIVFPVLVCAAKKPGNPARI